MPNDIDTNGIQSERMGPLKFSGILRHRKQDLISTNKKRVFRQVYFAIPADNG